ncbi:hypothetical protein QE152_g15920 [Popillia japonica]|uniref:Uncharacterized protein n=1 Tax=Popillia japonica TaxID=7064 RepID=A0AAW1L4I6_POPJA
MVIKIKEVSLVIPNGNNLSSGDFWNGASEEDATSALALDASDGGLWSGNFIPPPPRPLFLDDSVTPDGLTTCDLCSWAWQNGNVFTLDATMAPGEIGWVLTLVIVSVLSAAIGAVVMIIVLHCRRVQNSGNHVFLIHK